MWASTIRYQGSVGGKLRSLHWNSSSCECESGWLASGGEEGGVGVSWITREDSPCNSSCVESPINGSLYKSNFNLRGHIGGVGLKMNIICVSLETLTFSIISFYVGKISSLEPSRR